MEINLIVQNLCDIHEKEHDGLTKKERFILLSVFVIILTLSIKGSHCSTEVTKIKGHTSPGEFRHLILVAGHSVLRNTATISQIQASLEGKQEEDAWYLHHYQKGQRIGPTIKQHLELGLKELRKDPMSLLVISGGRTRKGENNSEAKSYYKVLQTDQFSISNSEWERIVLENYARDSLTNILYSIKVFEKYNNNRLPRSITTISFDFKEPRFHLHMSTLGIPTSNVRFLGYSPNTVGSAQLKGEKLTYNAFKRDPLGCHGKLFAKRQARDPWNDGAGEFSFDPAVQVVLNCVASQLKGDPNTFLHKYHFISDMDNFW